MPRRDGYQMDVVRHQAPREKAHFGIGKINAKEFEISMPIVDGRKRFPAIYAALRDVARDSRNETAWLSGHMVGCL